MSRIPYALVLLAALLAASAYGAPPAPPEPAPPPPEPAPAEVKPPPSPLKVGAFAPRFLLRTLNPEASGMRVFSTKRHVGSQAADPRRAVLISFGASHCAPCRKELPEIQKLAADKAAQSVMTVAVVIDQEPEGREAMRRFMVDELEITFPVLEDTFAVVGRRYGADVLPLNVLVDGDGKVAWFRAGFHDDTIAELSAAIDAVAPAAK